MVCGTMYMWYVLVFHEMYRHENVYVYGSLNILVFVLVYLNACVSDIFCVCVRIEGLQ